MDSLQIENISLEELKLLIEKMETQRELLLEQRCAYIDKLAILKPRHNSIRTEINNLTKQKKIIEEYNLALKTQISQINLQAKILAKKVRKIKAQTLQEATSMRIKAHEIMNSLQVVYKSTHSMNPDMLEIDMEDEEFSVAQALDTSTTDVPEVCYDTNSSVTVFQAVP
jgi:hypothetical protein